MGDNLEQTTRDKLVNEYLKGGISYRQLEAKYGIEHSTIHRWVLAHKGIYRDRDKEHQSKKNSITPPIIKTVYIENPVNEQFKQQLSEAELKIALLEEIISIAEKEQGLNLPKKFITELSKLSGKNKK